VSVVIFVKPTLSDLLHSLSLQLTAGRRDDQLEFMKYIVDVVKARFRQR
jgi:hypothetical protein